MMPAGQAGQNGDLAAGIAAVHVIAGVLGLGIAELLGQVQGLLKAHALPLHLGQHEVGRAIDDALDLADVVGRQALMHGSDDRGAAADARLKQKSRAVFPRQSQQFRTVGSNHLLVAGTDAAAALQAAADIRIGKPGAADGFDHHAHLRVSQDDVQVLDKQCRIRAVGEIPHVQDVFDLDRLPRAPGNGRGIFPADFQHAAADSPKPHDRDFCHV